MTGHALAAKVQPSTGSVGRILSVNAGKSPNICNPSLDSELKSDCGEEMTSQEFRACSGVVGH